MSQSYPDLIDDLNAAIGNLRAGAPDPMRGFSALAREALKPGALGEASIFEVLEQPTEYRDVLGEVIHSNADFKAHGLVLDGKWWT